MLTLLQTKELLRMTSRFMIVFIKELSLWHYPEPLHLSPSNRYMSHLLYTLLSKLGREKLAVETNNSELPRLNLDSKLSSHYKLNSNLVLPSCSSPSNFWNCSNVVSTSCMNNFFRSFTSQHKNNCITNNNSLRLKSKVNLHILILLVLA